MAKSKDPYWLSQDVSDELLGKAATIIVLGDDSFTKIIVRRTVQIRPELQSNYNPWRGLIGQKPCKGNDQETVTRVVAAGWRRTDPITRVN